MTKPDKPLTPKQERFACAYIETGNACEAYRRAYDCKGMKQTSIEVNACKLLASAKVAQRVDDLRAEHAERHAITVDSLTAMLLKDREGARDAKQFSAAITAVMGLAKLHGVVIDKSEVTGKNGGPIQIEGKPLSDLDFARRVAFILRRGEKEAEALQAANSNARSDGR